MGNAGSANTRGEEDIWWTNGNAQQEIQIAEITNTELEELNGSEGENSDRDQRRKQMQEDFIKFKQDLARTHEKRRVIIREKKQEMTDLRDELLKEKEENEKLRRLLQENRLTGANTSTRSRESAPSEMTVNRIKEENEDLRNEVEKLKLTLQEKEVITDKNRELRISLAEMQKELQSVNTQIISFEKERIDYQEHVTALKDVVRVTKEMLRVRESQIDELKKKITTIEELLASKEISILSDDLRQEYERQLRNIKDLRSLYEDRQRADKREKENLKSIIDDLKKNIEDEQNKNGELTERVKELEDDNSTKYDKLVNLESNLGLSKAECSELHAEMNIINQLFSQILISFNNDQDVDLDNMTKILEENHALLTNIIINDESSDTSALPKVLLDLVTQVNEIKKDNKEMLPPERDEELIQDEKVEKLDTIQEEEENQLSAMHQLNSPEEIVENLPKVWKVLIELLSHQSPPNNEITEKKGDNDNHCYKSVETPTGLRQVLSVSKTFIRLKSLILEKKSLEKEMSRLKQLNTHLEGRLSDQEKRLVLVSNELSKTWNFVGKMQKQHQQLHTQEKILRYELAQKRKLLTELKEELEYCRQKWHQAREQNSSTEQQWKQLRTEFASRKTSITDDINNSVESGYSDDKSSSDEDDAVFNNKSKGGVKSLNKDENNVPESNEGQSTITEDAVLEVPNEDSNTENRNVIAKIEEEKEALKVDTTVLNTRLESNQTLSSNGNVSEAPCSTDCATDLMHSLEVEKTDFQETKRQIDNTESPLKFNASTLDHAVILAEEIASTSAIVPDTLQQENTVGNIASEDNIEVLASEGASSLENVDPVENNFISFEQSASTSGQNEETSCTSQKSPLEAAAEFAVRREERMKRLEEQCSQLYFNLAKNSIRGMVMSNRLDNLHEIYGDNSQIVTEEEVPTTDVTNEVVDCSSSPATDSTKTTGNEDNQEQ